MAFTDDGGASKPCGIAGFFTSILREEPGLAIDGELMHDYPMSQRAV